MTFQRLMLCSLWFLWGCSTSVGASDASVDTAFEHTPDAADVLVSDLPVDTVVDRNVVDVGVDALDVSAPDVPCGVCSAPRPVAPITAARVTSRRPTLRWALVAGIDSADIELCADRACTRPITRFMATGESARVPSELPIGAVFWRMRGIRDGITGEAISPTWYFRVSALNAPVDTSWGSSLDVNGDGYGDLGVGARGDHVSIHHGGPSGIAPLASTTLRAPRVDGVVYPRFAEDLASAGDVNGDGYGDLVITSQNMDESSYITHVYLGSSEGLRAMPVITTDPPSESIILFYPSCFGLGDVNRDGYADFALHFQNGERRRDDRVAIYLGGPSGPTRSPSMVFRSLTLASPWQQEIGTVTVTVTF
jgi:hypothetical protein